MFQPTMSDVLTQAEQREYSQYRDAVIERGFEGLDESDAVEADREAA